MNILYGNPLTEKQSARAKAFLSALGLCWDDGIESSVILDEDGKIVAAGSRQRNVLKCIGVSSGHQGEGLAAVLISELVKDALRAGYTHLFIFTKPSSAVMFRELGFYDIAATGDAILLENKRNGIGAFVESLKQLSAQDEEAGCIVANCNPFTNGHLYLVQQAAERCGLLYLFILSEERSMFSARDRIELAKACTSHLRNVFVVPTSDYLISSATFPDYFIKDKLRSAQINSELDINLFATKLAPPLGIVRRFIGTEPFCPVTRAYNEQLKALLPVYGIEVEELPRYEINGHAVSASMVRALLEAGKLDDIRPLVPDATYQFLKEARR